MHDLLNHPLRKQLVDELHSRPFAQLDAPCCALYLAVSNQQNGMDRLRELAKLLSFPKPANGCKHYYETNADFSLRWEQHTEFSSFMIVTDAQGDPTQDPIVLQWLSHLKESLITSVRVQIHNSMALSGIEKQIPKLRPYLHMSDRVSMSYVLGRDAVVATDFSISKSNHVQMDVFPIGQVGKNRIGRITQRLVEIETYRAMSMMALPVAKDIFERIGILENDLTDIIKNISDHSRNAQDNLQQIMLLSSSIETLLSAHTFRFEATQAYDDLVTKRLSLLKEEQFLGKQMVNEFLTRRYRPSISTCNAAYERLKNLSNRASRAVELIGTEANLQTNVQNRKLLDQMDQRLAVQLRLQKTVEGLSVVAISYYAVNLLSYFMVPFGDRLSLSKSEITAILTLPTVLIIFFLVRRIRNHIEK